MSDFFLTLSFAAFPMAAVALFALTAPPLGAALMLRDEVLVSIALPPAGSAVVALAVLMGVPPESNFLLYIITAVSLFIIMLALPLGSPAQNVSLRTREIVLASLFCIGNTLTLIFMALSQVAESRMKFLLHGELLAITLEELLVTLVFTLGILGLGIKFRGILFSFCLDERNLWIKRKYYHTVRTLYRAVITLVITGGIIFLGPLLCTAFFVLPPLLAGKGCKGLESFFLRSIYIGLSGSMTGFLVSVPLDLPPAPLAVCGIMLAGMGLSLKRHICGRSNT